MSETIYEIRDLHLSFKDMVHKSIFKPAPEIEFLKGLSFDIAKGDVVGLLEDPDLENQLLVGLWSACLTRLLA